MYKSKERLNKWRKEQLKKKLKFEVENLLISLAIAGMVLGAIAVIV